MKSALLNQTTKCNRRNIGKSILINLSVILTLVSLQTSGQINVSGGTGLAATYASFTNASGLFAALNSNAQTGNNIVVTITADITNEAGTNSLNAGAWTTINITPIGARIVSGTVAGNPMINLNGADNVTFNGLNSGGNSLTISNLSTSSTSTTGTIRFIGGATSNNFTNCSILGSTTVISTTNGGVIFFSTDGNTSNGNDNNIFTSCNIGAAGSNLPSKLVYGNGSTTTVAIANSGNQFNSCNFSDAFLPTAIWNYINISTGNTDWTFNNNKFYSSGTRTQTTGTDNSLIRISNTTNGNNFQITNNIFGFANESGTGTFSVAGGANKFSIINVSVAITTASNISNNTISNISHSTTTSGIASGSPFILIYVQSGLTTVNNNVIGSQSATGSITFTSSSTSASDLNLIYNFGSSNWTTNNNTLGGVTVANSSTGAANLFALRCNTGSLVSWTCNNNTVGGTVSNSIQSTSTSTSTIVRGITTENPIFSCNGNIIRNLSMLAANTLSGTSSSIIGIFHNSSSNIGNTISNNTIHSLANNSATGATHAVGLYYGGATSGTNTISRNLIYNIHLATSSTGGSISGITTNNGLTVFHNNMIRLGFDLSGNSQTVGYAINGINDLVGTNNFFFNSIYIGGTGVVSSSNTFAFNSAVTTNTRVFQNNIFYNGRSNASGTGKNYAIRVGGSTANPSGLTTNYNVVLANGTGGVIGLFNGIDRTDLAAWKLATGQDANSLLADPQFLSPNATTPDLHINSSVATPIEAAGLLVASITNDFDNETRSTLTPTDIGADAGNFTAAPTMTYSSSNVTQVVGSACVGSLNIAVVRLEIVTAGVLSPLTLTNWSINGNGTSNLGDLTNYRIFSTGNNAVFNTSNPVSAIGTGLTSSPDVVVTPSGTVTLSTGSNYFWLVYNTTNTATGPNLDGEFTNIVLSSGSVLPTTTAPAGVVTLNIKPTVTLSPSTATYCNPGGTAVTLNANGALTYTYSPTTALSPTTGATVSATPSTTVTYTVTGTDVNGCTNTAVSTISVLPGISGLSASSTPSVICNGSTTDLKSTITNSSVAKNYTFSSGIGASLDAMASSTIVVGSGVDDAPMALSGSTAGSAQPIGFTFSFEGITYTHFSASPDGWIRLTNSTASIASEIANAMNSSVNIPKITPFWDDIATGTNGSVKIQINGVAPNRIFIVQWFVTIPRNTSGTANSTFQAWLYEGSNNIEFRYGTLGIPGSASAGITGSTTSNFQSITFSNNISSFTTANNSNSISPASGIIYTYTPVSFSYLWNTTPSITVPNTQDVTTNAISVNETFTVVATSSVGCTASANTTVTVSDNPAITTQPTNSVRCAGQPATFNVVASGVGLTYQWRKNGSNIDTINNPSAATSTLSLSNVSASDADNYDVVVSASCGTPITSSSASLTVNALPVVTITATNSGLICNPSGTAVSLTANNANTFVWSPSTGLSATNLVTVSANPISTQLYTVIGTDANGCTGSATSTVTVATKPIVTATSTPSTICSGTNSQLLATSNSLINSYQFSNSTTTYNEITTGTLMLSTNNDDDELFNNNLTGSTSSPLSGTGFPIGFSFTYNNLTFDKFAISTNGYIVLGTGTFSIASNTTAALSTSTTSGYANLIAAWNQDLGGQTGSEIQYLTTGSVGSRILTVQWKGYTRLLNTANLNFQIKLYESSNTIEFVYGSNTITTVASFAGGVGLRGATNATTNTRSTSTNWAATTAGINTSTCTMSNTLVPANGTVFTFSQSILSSYSWSPTTFLPAGSETTSNPIATAVNSTTAYTVTVANSSGCTATASTTVTLATPVTITTQPVSTLTRCVGQSATFTVVASGTGLTYQWRKNSADIVSATSATYTIPNVVLLDADVYDVIVTDDCNNTVTSQQSTLVVNGLPTVTLTTSNPSYYCSPGGTAVTLTADGATTYSYSPSTNLTPTTGSIVAATPTSTTTYTVTGTDGNGCTAQASAIVTVNAAVQNLSALATPASICTGGTSSLFANGFVPFTANNYAFTT